MAWYQVSTRTQTQYLDVEDVRKLLSYFWVTNEDVAKFNALEATGSVGDLMSFNGRQYELNKITEFTIVKLGRKF